MILIADSGSTKCEWCLLGEDGSQHTIMTDGMNPYFQSGEEIKREIMESLLPSLGGEKIDSIHFYGAGCAFPEKNRIIEEALGSVIPAHIEVESDLMAAARALCGTAPGIACILGTGSNSCLYDGNGIANQVSPLGFILGDEGSGAVLGKILVGDCLKRQLPEHICESFMRRFDLTPALLLERIYKRPFPNRFLASLSIFLAENISEPSIHKLVFENFRAFFTRNVALYKESTKYPVNFVGSIAYHYREVLKEAAESLGYTTGKIEKAPMPGLIGYHKGKP
ncbi:protein containing ATPase, BadF/BadG/BcrA/BcrD type domain protein [gut metagenome]|uniref:Protein containing ATPase, BadF/BadG/BcrA/BcrD type domain protein n=1 Tax=gut metagenome TaxID=749906 RepID=J9GM73_9ZZZZ